MASSGYTSVAVTSYDTLKFSWAQVSQSIANNTTTINWTLQLVAVTNGRIISTAAKAWGVTINGTTYGGTNTVGVEANTTKTLASGQTTIGHNADGSKSFSYSFSQEFGINFGGTNVGTKSGSGTGVLNVIPRATQPTLSVSSVDMGGSVTISTPRASTSFTHDLDYAFAGSGYTSIATGVATSRTWTVPDLAAQIPSATSGTVTIRCTTKNGGTVIGTKTVLLTVKVPTSVVPSISSVSTTEATSGLAAAFGAFIQGKSTVKAAITAAGAKGSTITKYSTTFQGKTYTSDIWTSSKLTNSGTLEMVTTVTDSRGRTAQKTTTINVLAYEPPRVTSFAAYRVSSNGAMNSEGTRALISFAYSVSSLGGKNTASATVQYKRSTDTTWSGDIMTVTDLNGSGSFQATQTFSTDYQYDLRIQVKDWFGATSTYMTSLPSGSVILDIRANGKGLSFFKTSERDGLEFGAQTKFSNGEVPQDAIVLASTVDLNNLTAVGFYTFSANSAQTIKNLPLEGASSGSVQVIREGENTQVRQVVTRCSTTNREIWERLYISGAWSNWACVYKGGGRVLWSGALTVNASHKLALAQKVSDQPTGIVLVFSRGTNNSPNDWHFNHFFVHKAFVAAHDGVGSQFLLSSNGLFEAMASKFLYIRDELIGGNANNEASGTANGITYNNAAFVLRYVLGV